MTNGEKNEGKAERQKLEYFKNWLVGERLGTRHQIQAFQGLF